MRNQNIGSRGKRSSNINVNVLFGVSAGIAIMALIIAAGWLITDTIWDKLKENSLTKIAFLLTVFVPFFGGAYGIVQSFLAYRKQKMEELYKSLDEDDRASKRLSRAIEHLSSDNIDICVSAIYELKRFIEQSPEDKKNIIWILIRFLESKTKNDQLCNPEALLVANQLNQLLEKEITENSNRRSSLVNRWNFKYAPVLSEDAHEIARLLSYLQASCDHKRIKVNLDGITANYVSAANVILTGANLQGAHFRKAILKNANLNQANLRQSDLFDSDLEGAHLRSAHLHFAILRHAVLRDADLREAQLRHADLTKADLRGADLRGTDLLKNMRFDQYVSEKEKLKGFIFEDSIDFTGARIDDTTIFDPGVRMKYFGEEEPDHSGDPRLKD